MTQNTPPFWRFTQEFFRNPRAVGALFPSSRWLARHMASLVPPGPGSVIELGPGVGPVTQALLASGVAAEDMVLVERGGTMVQQLRRRFPGVEVIHGDAQELRQLVAHRLPARAIVSSLPFRSLPPLVAQRILEEFPLCSRPGTAFIQFTYHPQSSCTGLPASFAHNHAHYVWRNLPPARVDRYLYQEPR